MSAFPRSRRLMQEKCAPAKEARHPSSSGFVENLQNATRAAKRATEEETEELLTEAAQDSNCAQAVDSNCGEDEDAPEKDDDEEDEYRDPPDGSVRLCPSQFCGLPPTVFFEYPPELRTKRSDASVVEQLGNRRLCYRSYWERVCIRNAFKRAGFERVEKSTSWTALWTKHQPQSVLKELNCLQKHNHFPASWCIGRKDRLTRTLTAMKRIHGSHFDFHPESFVLPGDRVALHKQIKTEAIAVSSSEKKRSSLWIIKPVAASCGKGIKVITAEQALSLPPKKTALVQRYLWDPYLIDGKKFDLRIYVLVAGVDPLRVYIHDEGLTRLSTANYSLKNIKNRFAHLTNYSINKKAEVFKAAGIGSDKIERNTEIDSEEEGDSNEGANRLEIDPTTAADPETEGYKWSLAAFRRWLARKEGQQMMEKTFDKIYDLCLKTMIAAESEITPSLHRSVNFRTNCFELFGCDVILDSQLQPHLLEVNVSPSLMGGSPLDKKIKGTLVADVLHTVGIYPHDPKLLHRFGGRAPDLPSSEHSSSAGANPFAFSSLSKIMCEQDTYRRNPCASTVDVAKLGEKNDSAWLMLLMIEDEMQRAKSCRFHCVHPSANHASFYTTLYRSCRFADHLLAKWTASGGSVGPLGKHIPSTYRRKAGDKTRFNNHPSLSDKNAGVSERTVRMDNRASSRNSAERIRSSSTGRPASADRTLSARAGIARPTAVDNNPTKQARGVDKSKPSFAQKSLSHPNEQHVHPNSSARTDWSGQSMGVRTSRPSSAYSRNSSFARFDPLQTDHQADQLYNQSLSAELAQIRSAKKSQPIKSYTENSSSPSNEAAMISLEKSKRSTCVTDQDTGPHLSMLPAFRTATSKKQVKSPRESSSRVSGSTAKDQVIAAEVEQSDNWVLHQFDNKSYNKKRNPAKSNEASAVTGLTLSTKQLQVSKMEKTVSEGEQLQFGSHTTKSNHKQNSAVPFDELSYEVRGVDWTIKGEVSTKASGRRFQSDHLPPPYNLLQVPVQPSRRVLRGTAEEMPDSEVEAAADVNSAERSKNHLQLYKALQLAEQQQEQKAENERRKEVADRRWVFGLVQNQSEEIGQTY